MTICRGSFPFVIGTIRYREGGIAFCALVESPAELCNHLLLVFWRHLPALSLIYMILVVAQRQR